MQRLIDALYLQSAKIEMLCNAQKSMAMIFNPRNRNNNFNKIFPNFTLESSMLQFVSEFRYLCENYVYMIFNEYSCSVEIV